MFGAVYKLIFGQEDELTPSDPDERTDDEVSAEVATPDSGKDMEFEAPGATYELVHPAGNGDDRIGSLDTKCDTVGCDGTLDCDISDNADSDIVCDSAGATMIADRRKPDEALIIALVAKFVADNASQRLELERVRSMLDTPIAQHILNNIEELHEELLILSDRIYEVYATYTAESIKLTNPEDLPEIHRASDAAESREEISADGQIEFEQITEQMRKLVDFGSLQPEVVFGILGALDGALGKINTDLIAEECHGEYQDHPTTTYITKLLGKLFKRDCLPYVTRTNLHSRLTGFREAVFFRYLNATRANASRANASPVDNPPVDNPPVDTSDEFAADRTAWMPPTFYDASGNNHSAGNFMEFSSDESDNASTGSIAGSVSDYGDVFVNGETPVFDDPKTYAEAWAQVKPAGTDQMIQSIIDRETHKTEHEEQFSHVLREIEIYPTLRKRTSQMMQQADRFRQYADAYVESFGAGPELSYAAAVSRKVPTTTDL